MATVVVCWCLKKLAKPPSPQHEAWSYILKRRRKTRLGSDQFWIFKRKQKKKKRKTQKKKKKSGGRGEKESSVPHSVTNYQQRNSNTQIKKALLRAFFGTGGGKQKEREHKMSGQLQALWWCWWWGKEDHEAWAAKTVETKQRRTVFTWDAEPAVKAEGFSARPMSRALGFLYIEGARGNNTFPLLLFLNSSSKDTTLDLHHQVLLLHPLQILIKLIDDETEKQKRTKRVSFA